MISKITEHIMSYPTNREISENIEVTIHTTLNELETLTDDIHNWTAAHSVNIFWVSCFLDGEKQD